MLIMRRLLLLFLVVVALNSGCGSKSALPGNNDPSADSSSNTPRTAVEFLSRSLQAYAATQHYSDRAVIRLSYQSRGEKFKDEQSVAVSFSRPNKLRVNAYQLTILADGKHLYARIIDPATQDVDQQVVFRPLPEKLQLNDLSGDPLLHDVLLGRVQRVPFPLELLLGPQGLQALIDQPGSCELLNSAFWNDVGCQRVEVKTPAGALVLWIGEKDFLLRRVDFPARQWFSDLAADPSVRDIELIADIREPSTSPVPAEAFAINVPEGAKKMRSFVVPPKPLPTNLFGQKPREFSFTDLEGKPLPAKDLEESIQVLMWFANHISCQPALEQLDQVRMELMTEKRVQFRAVCTEPEEFTNVQVKQLLSQWQVGLPVVRDFGAAGRDIFKIDEVPTLVVLDTSGKVQIFDERHNPELVHQLPLILQRLLKGEDLVKDVVAQADAEKARYAELIAAGGPEPAKVIELPATVIAPARPPQHMDVVERELVETIAKPGNLLALAGSEPRLGVISNSQSVVELDLAGKVLAEHKPELPLGGSFAWLRSASNRNGEALYLAGGPMAAQVYVLDRDWKVTLAYPPADQRHEGVRDAQLFDLDRDGTPELYVGFWSLQGLHGLSLEGQRIFRQRERPTILSITVTRSQDFDPQLLVTSPSGGIVPINRYGNFDPEVLVANQPILQLTAAAYDSPKSPSKTRYAALSHSAASQLQVLGLADDLKTIVWQADLPAGVHERPLEFITSGPLPGDRFGWLLAGADGSLQVISDDGTFRDQWTTGEKLAGIALVRAGERCLLVTASDRGVRIAELSERK